MIPERASRDSISAGTRSFLSMTKNMQKFQSGVSTRYLGYGRRKSSHGLLGGGVQVILGITRLLCYALLAFRSQSQINNSFLLHANNRLYFKDA